MIVRTGTAAALCAVSVCCYVYGNLSNYREVEIKILSLLFTDVSRKCQRAINYLLPFYRHLFDMRRLLCID